MELEDVQSDLYSLRKLYGLLHTSGDGLQNSSSENLDETARVLLKNLLDCATERVFETCSKIIAAQSGGLNTPQSIQSVQPRVIPRSKPPVSPNTLNISQCAVLNSSKDLNCPESSQKKKRSLTKPIPHEMVLEQSKFTISAAEPENRKKFCGSHNQCSMKQQNLAKKMQISNRKAVPTKDVNNQVQFSHFHRSDRGAKGLDFKEKSVEPLRGHDKPWQKRNCEVLRCDPRNIELLAASSRTLASGVECSLGTETEKKPEDVNYISKEVADTIKRIDSYIRVVQLIDDPVDLGGDKNTAQLGLYEKKASSIPIADSDSLKVIERKKGLVSRAELSQASKLGLAQNDLPSQQEIQRLRKPSDSSMLHLVMNPSQKSTSEGIDSLDLNKDKPKLPDWGGIQTFKPLQKSNSQLNQLVSQKGGQSKGSNLPANMLSPFWSPSTGITNPLSQKMNLVPGQNAKAVVEKFELVNQLASQNDPVASPVSDTIQGFRISPSHKDEIAKEAPLPVKVLNQIQKENRDQNLMATKGTIRKGVTSRSLVTPQSVGSAKKIQAARTDQNLSQTGTREMISKKKNLPPQMIVRPTLLDHYPSQRSLLPSTSYTDQGSGKQKHTYVSPHGRIMQPHHQQSEETTSSSCSSSSWTTQKTSSTCSESKGKEPLPGQAPLQLRRLGHATHRNRLEKDYSDGILPQYEHQDSSRRMTGIKTYRSGYQVNSKKAVGRLRRLKNKLAIIFHHHHHHHHHHHDDESEDTEAGHSPSLWKYVQKMFHPISKQEAYEEAVEKFRRSAVINAPHKQQGRHHLHAMVEGLLRHIRNSKKSKAGRGGISLVGNGQHGNKKMGKKLHWWQKIGGHGGVKLPNRGRIKVAFRSKKPQLRAGKTK